MSLLEGLRLALTQIRVQKLKSFFTLLGVTIGVMFLIAVVSIVEGLGTFMEQDVVGKVMAVNTFELRHRPNINIGGVTEEEWRAWQRRKRIEESDVPSVVAALPPGTRYAVVSNDNLTASSEFSNRPAKPRSAATPSGSSGSDEPARAPAPSGDTSRRRRASRMRSRSRASAQPWASRWWASSTGWARWRWV